MEPEKDSHSSMDVENSDDEVEREFEVFLSQNLVKNLHLLQFPLRPSSRPYGFSELTDVRFKSQHKKLEMDFSMDNSNANENYDHDTNHTRDMFSLTSTVAPNRTNYAIGVLRGDQLHLTPLTNVLQMMPNFEHLDVAEPERVVKPEEDESESEGEEGAGASSQGPELIQVQFKKKESERASEARKRSFAYLKEKEEQEAWVHLRYHPKDSLDSSSVFDRLFAPSFAPVPFDVPAHEFLDMLCPYPVSSSDSMQQMADAQSMRSEFAHMSLDKIRSLPGDKQVLAIMSAAKIARFLRVVELASNTQSQNEVLFVLERVAVLVQGLWVVKSEVLHSGKMAAVRDYLLSLFCTQQYVKRDELSDKAKVSPEVARDLLNEVAKLVPGKGWELKIPRDQDFVDRYPEVVARQAADWVERNKSIAKNLSTNFTRVQNAPLKDILAAVPAAAGSAGGPASADMDMAKARSKQLIEFFQLQFRQYGVCNMALLRQNFALVQSEKEILATVGDDVFNATLESLAQPYNGAFVLKSLGDPKIDKFRDVLVKALNEKKFLKKPDIRDAVMTALGEDIPPAAYTRILKEIGVSKGTGWQAKTGAGF